QRRARRPSTDRDRRVPPYRRRPAAAGRRREPERRRGRRNRLPDGRRRGAASADELFARFASIPRAGHHRVGEPRQRSQCGSGAARPRNRANRSRRCAPAELARGIALTATAERHQLNRLMAFFALVYVVEGLGQTGGLIAQPLNYFLKEQFGWTPVQVTAYLTALNFPWIIKPVYGIVSDFIPLFGYRRKAYLVLANGAAALAYFWVASLTAPGMILFALLLTAYAMAASSTLSGAVLVENGQRLGASDTFVNQEWLWFNIAAVASALLGGVLVEHLPPVGALHSAATIVGVAPFLAIFGSLFLIDEQRSRTDLVQLKATFRALIASFHRRELWLVGGFLFLYYFNPGFGTPLYYYMTDELRFSQQFIGMLGAVSSAGWIAGALIYRWALRGMTSRGLLYLSITCGAAATLLFLLLADP